MQSQIVHPHRGPPPGALSTQQGSGTLLRGASDSAVSPAPNRPLPPLPDVSWDGSPSGPPEEWSERRVGQWLAAIGFERFASAFAAHNITGDVITALDYETLKEIGVMSVGERARILQAIKKDFSRVRSIGVQTGSSSAFSPPPASAPPSLTSSAGSAYTWDRQPSSTLDRTAEHSPQMVNHVPSTDAGYASHTLARSPPATDSSQGTGTLRRSPSNSGFGIISPTGTAKNAYTVPELIQDIAGRIPLRKGSLTGAALAIERVNPSPLIINPHPTLGKPSSADRVPHAPSTPPSARRGDSAGLANDRADSRATQQTSPNGLFSMKLGLFNSDDEKKMSKDGGAFGSLRKKQSKEMPAIPIANSANSSTGTLDRSKGVMTVEGILAKCIRVEGIEEQSHIIQVADLPDIAAIKNRIFNKFGIKDSKERDGYAIYAPDADLTGEGPLKDEELLRLCKSRDAADAAIKNRLRLRSTSSYNGTLKTLMETRLTGSAGSSVASRSGNETIGSPQIKGRPSVRRFFRDSQKSTPSPVTASPVGSIRRGPEAVLQQLRGSPIVTTPPPPEPATGQQRSKKLADFFGERPPDELIVDQLEQFFPGIAKKTVTLPGGSPASTSVAAAYSQPPSITTAAGAPLIVPPRREASKDTLKRRVHAAMLNKRISKVAHRGSAYYARRGSDVLGKYQSENQGPHSSMLSETAGSPQRKDPAVIEEEDDSYESRSKPESRVANGPAQIPADEEFDENLLGSTWHDEVLDSLSYLRPSDENYGTPDVETDTDKEETPVGRNKPLPGSPERLYQLSSQSSASPSTPPQLETSIANKRRSATIRCELGKQIGQGAFGKVFIGLNLDTGELMAVKQVERAVFEETRKNSGDGGQQKREDALRREIDFLKELEHEHIVRYLGSEVTDASFNVFLEYISGGSVASCLNKYGAFDEELVQCMSAQILCGLEYLHEKSIIHRDIKGANILVDTDGVTKISDFGISKKNEYREAYHRVTRMSMQGSIPWMAPEVARLNKAKGYSAKVDIWSLGCLVLEMLTNQTPWHKARGNVIYLLGTGNAPPLPPSLSPASKSFIEKCFIIDPEKRPTATDLLSEPFTDVEDPLGYDFRGWVERASLQKQQRERDGVNTSTGLSLSTESMGDSMQSSYDELGTGTGGGSYYTGSAESIPKQTPPPLTVQTRTSSAQDDELSSTGTLHQLHRRTMSSISAASPRVHTHTRSLSSSFSSIPPLQNADQIPRESQPSLNEPLATQRHDRIEPDILLALKEYWDDDSLQGTGSYVDRYLSTETLDT